MELGSDDLLYKGCRSCGGAEDSPKMEKMSMKNSSSSRMSMKGGRDWKICRRFLRSRRLGISHSGPRGGGGLHEAMTHLRTAPQYRQSTRKMGRRARVTRRWDICRTSTTMASTNWRKSTQVCGRGDRGAQGRSGPSLGG